MFISRIGLVIRNYFRTRKSLFVKIGISANKMQTLLIDLVNYSRTVKEIRFFEVNLNDIVKLVIDDLSSDIEDKKQL
jgi:hypothetical protein